MKSAESSGWSSPRWFWTVLLVFALQLAFIFWLSDQNPLDVRQAPPPRVQFMGGDPSNALADPGMALSDPTVFAGVHPRGFSGSAWLRAPEFRYETKSWSEPAPRLQPQPTALAGDFVRFVRQQTTAPQPGLQKPSPDPAPPTVPGIALPGHPQVTFHGSLSARPLVGSGPLPATEFAAVLTNTVVRMMISGQGDPLSATVVHSSGSTEADRRALDYVRALQFEPARELSEPSGHSLTDLAFGEVVFQWFSRGFSAASTAQAPPGGPGPGATATLTQ
jgi:TonB family protein